MLDKLLTIATGHAKLALAAAAGAALVAGGSAVAIQQVSDSSTSTSTVTTPVKGGEHASDQGEEQRSDTATATISPKPSHSPEESEAPEPSESPKSCTHGAAVSAAAHDRSTHGREHGKAVSKVAHDKSACATKTDDGAENDGEHANDATDEHDSDASEAPRPARTADSENEGEDNGSEHSGGHGQSDKGHDGGDD